MPLFGEYFNSIGLSTEALAVDGTAKRELEFTMYVKLDDLNELKQKAQEVQRHEQWLIPVEKKEGVKRKMRIRLVDDKRAYQTVKTSYEAQAGCEEVEDVITMDMFRALRGMGTGGYHKTRYVIPSNIRGLEWEVDVFFANGGGEHPWVKVDLEVKSLNDPIPVFPLKHGRVIYADEALTHSDKEQVANLWDKEWQRIDV